MIKTMFSYDVMESVRNTQEWAGASAKAIASYPLFSMFPNPAISLMEAWGEVTERSFARMVARPSWGIHTVVGEDGRDLVVNINKLVRKPFADLIHFSVEGRDPMPRRVLVVAPMSGHYATLTRSTVASLLPDCEVFVTDWNNARDIPVSAGKFDIEDFTLYLVDFMRHLGPDLHVIAICQPAPLALAATALLAEEDPAAQPRSLVLIGGPIDPEAAPTEVTDFGDRISMGQLERYFIQRVGFKYEGVGRLVYPGLQQLTSFIAMNRENHTESFVNQIVNVARGDGAARARHYKFYDEYLAVMDMTAEFYLSTVQRIFKGREIARNAFTISGKPVDIGKITDVSVMIVEGEKDDISAPGQCLAALPLLTGLDESRKVSHLEPDAGHYGIFAGGAWRNNIRPVVLNFIDTGGKSEPRHRKARSSVRVVAGTDTPAAPKGPKPA